MYLAPLDIWSAFHVEPAYKAPFMKNRAFLFEKHNPNSEFPQFKKENILQKTRTHRQASRSAFFIEKTEIHMGHETKKKYCSDKQKGKKRIK